MKKIILALTLATASFGAMAEYDANDGLAARIDQDAVTSIDSNMMWADNCEYQLNARVARPGVDTDGVVDADDDWSEILGTLCDHSMGFSSMF